MRPANGRLLSKGRCSCGAGTIFSPTKPAPIRPESPIPRMVSASPVATWLTARPRVSRAKIADSAAPAAIPQSAPTRVDPVRYAPAKAQAAPMIIIPSTPRLSTPARSTTSSPDAASRSGVEAASTARMIASASPIGSLAMRGHEANAVEHERVAGEHIEQQNALEHLGQVERDAHRNLRLLAADEGERQEQSGNQYPDRIEAPQERNDDRREAVARRNVGPQVSDRAGNLDDAGKPGERPGYEEGEDRELVRVEAGKARRPRGRADHLDLETLDGPSEQDHRRNHQYQSDERAGMKPAALDENRNRRNRIEIRRGRKIVSLRIAPGTANQIVKKKIGDINQHQAGKNFARTELHLADRGDERIERASQRAEHEHGGQHPVPGVGAVGLDREPASRHRADEELSLGADVPDIGEITEREAERDHHQGGRLHCDLLQRIGVGERVDEVDPERRKRILAE